MSTDSKTEIGEFFNAWNAYRKVLENNYMFHKEIYQVVGQLLREQPQDKPFKLLDLGCGDASFLSQALQGAAINYYTGYDLSEPALNLAAENIGQLDCRMELVNGDFMAGLSNTREPFDIIFTSFAVHHLTYPEKAEFFQLARAALADDGFLLMIDIMRDPGQNLSDYLDAYCLGVQTNWLQLEPEEMTASCHHIRHYDLPETAETLAALAKAAGFRETRPICGWNRHNALQFYV